MFTPRRLVILCLLLATAIIASAQDKKPAEKIIELPKLTSRIVKEKVVPIWAAHKCDNPEVFYIIIYGSPREIIRRRKLLAGSIAYRCDIIGFRVLFIDVSEKTTAPNTVIWRTFPNGELPIP